MAIVETAEGFAYWDELGKEELAVMKNVRWGIIDSDHYPTEPSIGMTVEMIVGCSDLRLSPEQSLRLAVDSGVSDISKLNGKPCVVVKDNGYIRFIRRYG